MFFISVADNFSSGSDVREAVQINTGATGRGSIMASKASLLPFPALHIGCKVKSTSPKHCLLYDCCKSLVMSFPCNIGTSVFGKAACIP